MASDLLNFFLFSLTVIFTMFPKGWQVFCGLFFICLCEALLYLGEPHEPCTKMRRDRRVTKVVELEFHPCIPGSSEMCPVNVTRNKVDYVLVPTEVCCTGYDWSEREDGTEVCIPQCRDNCIGGRCIKPGVCVCDKPLVLVNHACITPVCDEPCTNSECTAPNICTCNDGYTRQDTFHCVPHCTDCNNGDCTTPDTCVCHTGYTKNEGQCSPVCNNCVNGTCTAPDECTCNVGYKYIHGICKPDCNDTCINANCVAPGVCECLDGYKPKEGNDEVCEPKCASCANGACVSPNVCFCPEDYALVDEDCSPICNPTCVNGYCSAPSVCTCEDGYMLDVLNSSICSKPCSICIDGTCNHDGECICEDESELINGTCVLLIPEHAPSTTTGLASLEMSWVVGGAVCLLLVVLVIVSINRIWRRRKDFGTKETADNDNHYAASVVYTLPDTLIREEYRRQDAIDETEEDGTTEKLMSSSKL